MKILVTGAAGFIGYHTSTLLLSRGDEVVGLDNLNDYYDVRLKLARVARLERSSGFRFVKLDLADNRLTVGVDEMVADFVRANPGLKPDMVAVACGGPGNRLKEVRICFDKGGEFRACGQNENQRRLCGADRMYVPPVRQTGFTQPRSEPRGGPREPSEGRPDGRPEEKGPPLEIAPGPRDRRL